MTLEIGHVSTEQGLLELIFDLIQLSISQLKVCSIYNAKGPNQSHL